MDESATQLPIAPPSTPAHVETPVALDESGNTKDDVNEILEDDEPLDDDDLLVLDIEDFEEVEHSSRN